MPNYPKGLRIPRDLANRIKVSHSRYGARLASLQDVTIPEYDCRDSQMLVPIKDQKNCGDCYNFAAVCCAESAAINGGLGTNKTLNWAEQSALDCGDVGGCGGGWPEQVLEYIKNSGIANTSDYPYAGRVNRCKNVPHNNRITNYGYVGSSDTVPSTQLIKNAIYEHGPLAVAVAADDAFMNYVPGTVFKDSGSQDIDHAVVLVGWDDSLGCWIMRNSWNTSWGNEGYMNIAYGANLIGYGAMWSTAGNPPSPNQIDWTRA
jgi:C1A family cysteine protease